MFDRFLAVDGPIAFTAKIPMRSILDDDTLFPPTYPQPEGSREKGSVYNICPRGDGTNTCMLDNEPSQANRMEEVFKAAHVGLVPQVAIKVGDGSVNILDLNHRIADAVLRTTSLADVVRKAVKDFKNGTADGIAAILPTSLVFGFWDSRETTYRWPRVIQSTIKAFNVTPQTRFSQFHESKDAVRYLLDMIGLDRDNLEKVERDALSERGFLDCPNTAALGGVNVNGDIIRSVSVDLASIKALRSATNSLDLQRYVLGLTLVALIAPQPQRLRQGCTLVPDLRKPAVQREWFADGRDVESDLLSMKDEIVAYATAAAEKFKTSPIVAEFEKDRVDAMIEFGKNKNESKNGVKNGKKGAKKKLKETEESEEVEAATV